jgi:hypothetical protein
MAGANNKKPAGSGRLFRLVRHESGGPLKRSVAVQGKRNIHRLLTALILPGAGAVFLVERLLRPSLKECQKMARGPPPAVYGPPRVVGPPRPIAGIINGFIGGF